jgi:hypothetical protein
MSRNDTVHDDIPDFTNTYRVSTLGYVNSIEVTCLGMNCVDSECEGLYDLEDDVIPEWLEHKLAVLMLCDYTPPTEPVEGIGTRID